MFIKMMFKCCRKFFSISKISNFFEVQQKHAVIMISESVEAVKIFVNVIVVLITAVSKTLLRLQQSAQMLKITQKRLKVRPCVRLWYVQKNNPKFRASKTVLDLKFSNSQDLFTGADFLLGRPIHVRFTIWAYLFKSWIFFLLFAIKILMKQNDIKYYSRVRRIGEGGQVKSG